MPVFVIILIAVTLGFLIHHGMAARFCKFARGLMTEVEQGHSAKPRALPDRIRRLAITASVGPKAPRSIRLTQCCRMRLAPDRPWLAMEAVQVISPRNAAFAWVARRKKAFVTLLTVVDALVDGKGILEARLFGSIPIAKATGPDVDHAELIRYLAELPWAPDATVFNSTLDWRENEDGSITVSCTVDPRSTVTFLLDGDDIVQVKAMRPRTSRNQTILSLIHI